MQPAATLPHIEVTQKPTTKLHLGIFDGLRDYTKFRRPEKPLFFNGIWQVVDDARYEVFLYRYINMQILDGIIIIDTREIEKKYCSMPSCRKKMILYLGKGY